MTPAKIAILKKKLLSPNDYGDAMDYFLGHFATQEELHDKSVLVKIQIIQDIIGQICARLFKKEAIVLTGLMTFRVKGLNLLHSNCYVEGRQIVLFYLTDIDKGVFAVSNSTTLMTEHVGRVSALPLCTGPTDGLYDDVFDGRDN